MSILNIILLSVLAAAGGWLSGYTFFSKTNDTGDEAKKERQASIFFSCVIALLVGLTLFLMGRIVASPDAWFVLNLLVVIVLSGALGGLIGYYYKSLRAKAAARQHQNPKQVETSAPLDDQPSLLHSIVMGIGAALLVPLLLHILTSNLLTDIGKNPEKGFVLAGLCLAAAISSEVFIEKIIRQFNKMAAGPAETS
jgi:hypothetical protein